MSVSSFLSTPGAVFLVPPCSASTHLFSSLSMIIHILDTSFQMLLFLFGCVFSWSSFRIHMWPPATLRSLVVLPLLYLLSRDSAFELCGYCISLRKPRPCIFLAIAVSGE